MCLIVRAWVMGPYPATMRLGNTCTQYFQPLWWEVSSALEWGEFPITGSGLRSWLAKKKNKESNMTVDVKEF